MASGRVLLFVDADVELATYRRQLSGTAGE
jgi:hypothetical protein